MDHPEQHSALVRDLNNAYGMTMAEHLSAGQLESALAAKLNALIKDDFHGLVVLLYRIDINEAKLRQLLESNRGTDAGKIIAGLIIDRQLQKIESRKIYKKDMPSENDCGEERW